MITNKKQLKEILSYEKNLYVHKGNYDIGHKKDFFVMRIAKDQFCRNYDYVKLLRKTEYYYNLSKMNALYRIPWLLYRRKKNTLGTRIGIEMTENTFEKGLIIWHCGGIVVNGASRIGEDCIIHGRCCIGNDGVNPGCPKIGNKLDVGVGANIIGNIVLGNNVTVAAGAVVVNSFEKDDIVLAGVPARIVKNK